MVLQAIIEPDMYVMYYATDVDAYAVPGEYNIVAFSSISCYSVQILFIFFLFSLG